MKTYLTESDCEQETYAQYKQKKEEQINKLYREILSTIWDSSLKLSDKMAIEERIRNKN